MRQLLYVALALLVLQTANSCSKPRGGTDHAGDVYEIRLESVTQTSSDGSSGNSHDATMLVERVIAVRDNGLELEFDLPEQASPEERARTWQFPVRVFRSSETGLQLLNGSELEARVKSWLQRGGLTEAACGRWIFTWTAEKIECDPGSVLKDIEPYDLRLGDVRDGAPYSEAGALGLAPLRIQSHSDDGQNFVAELEIDPEAVRRERAGADVVIAEIMGGAPLALEDALKTWAKRQVSGTIKVTLETDAMGRVVRRTQVTNLVIANEDGSPERQTSTVTVERRQISPQRP